jgi:alanine dehydrogenase
MKEPRKQPISSSSIKESIIPQEQMLMMGKRRKLLTIGIPKESDKFENRLCLTPQAVETLVDEGHTIYMQKDAGLATDYSDLDYSEKGAIIVSTKKEVFQSDIIIKAAPFDMADVSLLRGQQTVFSALHQYTQTPEIIRELIRKKITGIALENYKDADNCYAFVRSMSEIAGYSSILIASEYLSNARGGKGVMLGGITGVSPSEIVVLGAGTAGEYAARAALGLGAAVKVFDYSLKRLRRIQDNLGQKVFTSTMHKQVLEKSLLSADVVVGAIRSDVNKNRYVITEQMVSSMKPGAFIVDLAVDNGGCIATSKMMTLAKPSYVKYKVNHFCVPNIASRVPKTATIALSNIFVPLIESVGDNGGITASLKHDIGFRQGVYMYNGILTNQALADKFGMMCRDINLLMAVL